MNDRLRIVLIMANNIIIGSGATTRRFREGFCHDVTLQNINHRDRVNQTVLYPKVTAQLLEKKLDNFEYGSNHTTPSSFDISTTENSSLTTPLTSTMTTHSTVTTTNNSKDTTIFISTFGYNTV
jgi:hypothetical protein